MPLISRRTYLKRRVAVFTSLALVLGGGIYIPTALLSPLDPVAAQSVHYATPASTAATLDWPSGTSSAVGAADVPGILASNGTTEPRPIASISKVITSLVVLDEKPLKPGSSGPDITFDATDAALYDSYRAKLGTVKPVHAGLVLSQLQLMQVVLVSSANNYADSLSRWAFGSRAAFLAATKAWLAAHSLTGTTLLEPTGMNPGNTSTASDLVSIGKLVLANPVLAAIVSTKSVTVPEVGVLTNTNKLLGIDGIDGIKTGTLREAGACLLFAATVPVGSRSVTVVGAVLGGEDHRALDAAVRSLLDSVADGFEEVTLTHAGDEFAHYRTPWAGQAAAVAGSDETVALWRGTPVHATVDTVPLRTGLRGAAVGAVTFTIGSRTIKIPLTLDRDIADPGPWWRLTNP